MGTPAWDSPRDESARHCGPCWLLHFRKPASPHPKPPSISATPWGVTLCPPECMGWGGGRGVPGSLHRPSMKGRVSLQIRCCWCWAGPLPCLHHQGAPDNCRQGQGPRDHVTVYSGPHVSSGSDLFLPAPNSRNRNAPWVLAACTQCPLRLVLRGGKAAGVRGTGAAWGPTELAMPILPPPQPLLTDSGLPSFEAKLLWVGAYFV